MCHQLSVPQEALIQLVICWQVLRLQLLVECIVEYALEVLTQREGMSLRSDLELPEVEPTRDPKLYQMRDSFCAVLYNDESHTFEDVRHSPPTPLPPSIDP